MDITIDNKNNAFLIDYHKTIVNDNNEFDNDIIELIKALNTSYEVIIFTAREMTKKDYDKTVKQLDEHNIKYKKFLYLKHALNNDVETKLGLYQSISKRFDVRFIIDNNKDVIKSFRRLGIYCLLAKEPKQFELSY